MMKIYALRDRLIDYYMQPFVGPDDKNVLASVARLVNNGEVTSDITQAPHQFEVWSLGHVTDDGHLVPERNYLADCASLVRAGIRKTPDTGAGETPGAEIQRHRSYERLGGANGADPTPTEGGTPPAAGSSPPTDKAAR